MRTGKAIHLTTRAEREREEKMEKLVQSVCVCVWNQINMRYFSIFCSLSVMEMDTYNVTVT